MNLKPLSNNVIIKASGKEEMTKAGIFLPDTMNKEKPEQGEILAVGPGKIDNNGNKIEMNVKVGQKVVFKKYSPDEVKIDDEEYLIINEEDILAILE